MVINCVNASLRFVLKIMLFSLTLCIFMHAGQNAVMGSTISGNTNPTPTEAAEQQRASRRAQAEAIVPRSEVKVSPKDKTAGLSTVTLQEIHRIMNDEYREYQKSLEIQQGKSDTPKMDAAHQEMQRVMDDMISKLPPADQEMIRVADQEMQRVMDDMDDKFKRSPAFKKMNRRMYNNELGRMIYALTADNEDRSIFNGNTTLASYILLAIKYKNNDLLADLLLKGQNYEDLDYTFHSPVDFAIKYGNSRAVSMLVEAWGQEIALAKVFMEQSSIVSAVKHQRGEIGEYLLSLGYYIPATLNYLIVDAILAGQRNIAIGILAVQENIVITTDQYNEIYQWAMGNNNYSLAEEVVGKVTEVKQEHLYFAAANGYKNLALALVGSESVDVTLQADQTYFSNFETKGLTAAEIARGFGHVGIAAQLKTIENEKLALKKAAEEKKQREALLALEIPNLGDIEVSVFYRFLGFKGQNLSHKWVYNGDLIEGLRYHSWSETSFPLNLGSPSNPELKLYVSQKRGLTVLSSMTNEVRLSSPNGESISFTFNTSSKLAIKDVAFKLVQRLKKTIETKSEVFARMRAERDKREIARTAKIKWDRLEKERVAALAAQIRKTILELVTNDDLAGLVEFFNNEPMAEKFKGAISPLPRFHIPLLGPSVFRIWDIAELSRENNPDQHIIGLIQKVNTLYGLDFSIETNRVLSSLGISEPVIQALRLHEKVVALKIEQQRKIAKLQAEIRERKEELEEEREREEEERQERIEQARQARQDREDKAYAQQKARDWQQFFDKQKQDINDVVNTINQSTRETNRIMRQAANQREDNVQYNNARYSNNDDRQYQNFKQQKQQSIKRVNQEYAQQLALLKQEQQQLTASASTTPAQEKTGTCYQIFRGGWGASEDAAYGYTNFYKNKNTGDKLDTDGAGRPITFEKVYTRKYVHSFKKGGAVTKVYSAAISRLTSPGPCNCIDLSGFCSSVLALQSLIDNEYRDKNFDNTGTLLQ